MSNNPWDLLSDYFDTSKDTEEIPSGAADNIYIAWPVFLRCIKSYFPVSKNKKVLEYGCGGGSFAQKLFQLGFTVTGIDASKDMIHVAQNAYGAHVTFYAGDAALLKQLPAFDMITSIMTLQFIEDVEKTIAAFSQAIVPNGLLIFTVHNPDFVKEGISKHEYPYYDSADNPTKVTLRFENAVEVPMFIRTGEAYNALAQKYQLQPLVEEYPPFTQEFIKKYPDYAGHTYSEYLILGYKKE